MKKHIIYAIVLIVILCTLFIVGAEKIPYFIRYKDGLIPEIIGSGILGFIITLAAFFLQETAEVTDNKNKSKSNFENKVLVKIREIKNKEKEAWTIGSRERFYFCNSFLNYLYDIYDANYTEVNDYINYFPQDNFAVAFKVYCQKLREGYLFTEQLDSYLKKIVRDFHHTKEVQSYNDGNAFEFLRIKLFTGIRDEETIKYLNLQKVPENYLELYNLTKDDEIINNLIPKLQEARQELLKLEKTFLI